MRLNPYVRLIERLYREGQADAVLIGVRSVSGSTDLDNKSLAQLAVLEGMLQVDQVEEEAARDAFKRAFSLDYDVALPSNPSSKASQLFQATQAEYRKTHARPAPPPDTKPQPKGEEWKWGLVGGGAAGTVAGVVVLAASNGQQGVPGGLLLGAGAVTAIVGMVALSAQAPESKTGSAVSFAITPRGEILATYAGRF